MEIKNATFAPCLYNGLHPLSPAPTAALETEAKASCRPWPHLAPLG